MSRRLEDVLNENVPKDKEKIKQLIDRVLEKKRTEIGNGAGFDFADINARDQKVEGYNVETLGEALMYIADKESYSKIRANLDELNELGYNVRINDPEEFRNQAAEYGFPPGAYVTDRQLDLCGKTKLFYERMEINTFCQDWVREFCKYYSRMLLEKAASDKDLGAFMMLKLGELLYALNAEDWFDEEQDIIPFDRIDDELKARTIGDILQSNLDNSKQEWNMTCDFWDFRMQVRAAVDNIRALILLPLMIYYERVKGNE